MFSGKDSRTVARDLLAVSQDEFSVAFTRSPIKRAKLRGFHPNAAVVLGTVGTVDDADMSTRALENTAASGPMLRTNMNRPAIKANVNARGTAQATAAPAARVARLPSKRNRVQPRPFTLFAS